ncbi:MAG TPA: TIGR04255 family protein [Acidimicrobiia bacterium]|nr:TIGR04255 family protein [Acidimicrobiia bacterium]
MLDDLPNFTNPPVVERALSVAFSPLEGLSIAHLAKFWSRVEKEFPRAHSQPPYEMPIERLDGPPGLPSIELRLETTIRPRMLFVTEDDQELIQVQADWFAFNWRRPSGASVEYSRYPTGRERFETYFDKFLAFVEETQTGKIVPHQCEVTYINHVPSSLSELDQLSQKVTLVNSPDLAAPARSVEGVQYAMSMRLSDPNLGDFGRLHLQIQPGATSDGKSLYVITLTARGRPLGHGTEGVLGFFDLGRKAIVRNFVSFTTESMHRVWGLS